MCLSSEEDQAVALHRVRFATVCVSTLGQMTDSLALSTRKTRTLWQSALHLRLRGRRTRKQDGTCMEFTSRHLCTSQQPCMKGFKHPPPSPKPWPITAPGYTHRHIALDSCPIPRSAPPQEWKSASTGAAWVGNNFSGIAKAVPTLLNTVSLIHKITGPKPLLYISRWLNRVSDHYIPVWNPYMPRGAAKLQSE